MVWDITTPLGTESKSQGDDRIRELKTDIQTALRADEATGTEAIFPGSDTSSPVYRYRGLKGTTAARPAAGQYGLYVNETLNTIQRDNGSSWVDVATLIPSGTVMCFFQAAVPTGWTQVTTQNDKVLRVVSSTGGGSGGTIATSTTLAHTHTVAAHTHTVSDHTHDISHTHELDYATSTFGSFPTISNVRVATNNVSGSNQALRPDFTNSGGSDGITKRIYQSGTGSQSTSTSGSGGAGSTGSTAPATDSQLAGALAYADVVIGSKD